MKQLSLSLFALAAAFAVSTATAGGSSLKILKFEADWCGPCQQMKPGFASVSNEYRNDASFVTVNVDRNPAMAEQYGIKGLPTVIAVKDGRVVARKVGYQSTSQLEALVKRHR